MDEIEKLGVVPVIHVITTFYVNDEVSLELCVIRISYFLPSFLDENICGENLVNRTLVINGFFQEGAKRQFAIG